MKSEDLYFTLREIHATNSAFSFGEHACATSRGPVGRSQAPGNARWSHRTQYARGEHGDCSQPSFHLRQRTIKLITIIISTLMGDFWDARWQQTDPLNPLFLVMCACSEQRNDGNLPDRSAAT